VKKVYYIYGLLCEITTACRWTHLNVPCLYHSETIYIPRRDGRLSWPGWLN